MEIAGKTVFISGGGGGIGGGMAQAFAEKGARIVLADINLAYTEEESAKLPLGTEVELIALDVTSLQSWNKARTAAEKRFGPVDVLCNNAGISVPFKPLLDVPPEEFARTMAVNVTGVYNGLLTFAPGMCERRSGHIVNTSSMNGLAPFGGMAAYSASKFAVMGLSDSVRQELAPFGIGISTLCPGLTRSRMSETNARERAAKNPELAAKIGSDMMDPVWLGRAVVRAVERNEPYIITHPQYRGSTKERFDQILAAFGEPAQPGYGAE
jgi:NAD(P)-dependent dehydrogenase (short-subunit alcohol dehydrogenase family)